MNTALYHNYRSILPSFYDCYGIHYLIMVFDAHAESVDENGTEQGLLEIFILDDSSDTPLKSKVTILNGLPAAVLAFLLLLDFFCTLKIAKFLVIAVITVRGTATSLVFAFIVGSIVCVDPTRFQVSFAGFPGSTFPFVSTADIEIRASSWLESSKLIRINRWFLFYHFAFVIN